MRIISGNFVLHDTAENYKTQNDRSKLKFDGTLRKRTRVIEECIEEILKTTCHVPLFTSNLIFTRSRGTQQYVKEKRGEDKIFFEDTELQALIFDSNETSYALAIFVVRREITKKKKEKRNLEGRYSSRKRSKK